MSRSRSWTYTLNNYTQEDEEKIGQIEADYKIMGREVGENGTPHLQGYVYFKNARSFKAVKKAIGDRAHIEVAKGNAEQNRAYCSKDGDFVEDGELPRQGKRSDIAVVKEVLAETNSMAAVVEVSESYQACKMAELILKYKEPARPYGTRNVYWYWGDTGTGKTYTVYETAPDVFTPLNFKWWDGYDGQKEVLLDDIRGDYCKFHEMLMLTGERPFRVECKGGSRQAVYDTIYITSALHPNDLWATIEDKSQLLDRITEIRHFSGLSRRIKIDDI